MSLFIRDNLLKFGEQQITYYNTELYLHLYNTITHGLIQRRGYF